MDELDWSAQSPGLDLIEYLQDEKDRRLRARPSSPKSMCELTMPFYKNGQKNPMNTLLNIYSIKIQYIICVI